MPIESLAAYTGAIIIAAMIPGPGVLALVGCALGRGSKMASGFLIGMIFGDMVYLNLAAAGLAALAQTMGEAFFVVKLLGAAYLIFLGITLWRAASKKAEGPAQTINTHQLHKATLFGFTTTLGNPKTMVFYMGVMPMVIDMNTLVLSDVALLNTVNIFALIIALSPYIFAASRARKLLKSQTAVKRMNKGSGAVLIGAGGAVALT
ncbi:MAG: LysE family translocator [Alphaproteobacteria bacterium]|nr:LysE family translocator [Rhodospirillales bacterium]MCW9045299.1 LysE family translocator [Alphaproteobacteria bacterium]